MIVRRIMRFVAAALACAALAAAARAQDYPTRPIKVVIAFPPGGPTDFVGRLLADKLKELLGQPVIIENKAGASGAIGANEVAKSAPDGYTLFLTTSGAVTITPNLRADTPYDTLRDFAPISRVVDVDEMLVVRPELGAKSAKDLADMAKAKPGTLAFASTGVGSPPHLALELFQDAAGVKFVHVPYRGAAPAITDLLGGQVIAMFADAPVLLPQIQAGKLMPIGVAATQRNPALPDVPTLGEQGYANAITNNWYGLLAPAKTPPAVIAKLDQAVHTALADPVLKDKLVKVGAVPAASTPEAFRTFLGEELARWGKVIREKGIKEE
ncbi:MAG TPA: tripartite tricarboxylate transporter substrate binding protein [Xanthobacteraceae bacterium]|nr:tripartite tricarboxylate transporter substrate binding protein [Xanthobacteraceae bacterium]